MKTSRKRKYSLARIVFWSLTLVGWLPLIFIGILWVVDDHVDFRRFATMTRQEHFLEVRRRLKNVVDQALVNIAYDRQREEESIETSIRLGLEQDKDLLIINGTHLRDMIFNHADGTNAVHLLLLPFRDIPGFFFSASQRDQSMRLFSSDGSTLKSSSSMRTAIQTAIDFSSTSSNEIVRMEQHVEDSDSILLFALAIDQNEQVIGWGIPRSAYVSTIQARVLERLRQTQNPDGQLLFGGTFDGVSILGPAVGKNMIDAVDVNGVAIVRELIAAAQNGGGFVQYVMPAINGQRTIMKLSYAAAVPGWPWYIGAGSYLDDIEAELEKRQAVIDHNVVTHFMFIGSTMIALGLVCLFLSRCIAERIRRNINLFSSFFKKAAESSDPIPDEEIVVNEFIELAVAANTMIETREAALAQLRESEERYRGIYENTMDGYYRADMHGRLVMASPSALSMVGYTSLDELAGQDVAQILYRDPSDRNRLVEHLLQYGAIRGFRTTLVCKDGSSIEVETNSRLITSPETGEAVGVEGILRDVTKQHEAQKELATREQYYRSLFENTGAATIIYGDDMIIRSCNSRFVELSGYSLEEIVDHMSWTDFAHPCEHGRMKGYHAARIHPDLNNTAPPDYDFTFLDRAGQVKTVHMRVTVIPGTHQRISSMIDITDRKQVEEKLAQLNRDLEALVQERTAELEAKAQALEDANVRLRELDELKSSLLSSVSHELRTPLTSIMGFAKITGKSLIRLLSTYNPSETHPDAERFEREYERILDNLDIIAREGERLTRLINDFLDLDKIESGLMHWRDADIDPSEAIQHGINAVRGQFEANSNVKLVVDVGTLPFVHMDRDKLSQVVINLLNNAAKFTEEGEVRLRAVSENNVVKLTVTDTGEGIAKEHHDRIFDKFHKLDNSDTLSGNKKGTGLGLSICKQIIEHYGGRIWVESEPENGSQFIVVLPIVENSTPGPNSVHSV